MPGLFQRIIFSILLVSLLITCASAGNFYTSPLTDWTEVSSGSGTSVSLIIHNDRSTEAEFWLWEADWNKFEVNPHNVDEVTFAVHCFLKPGGQNEFPLPAGNYLYWVEPDTSNSYTHDGGGPLTLTSGSAYSLSFLSRSDSEIQAILQQKHQNSGSGSQNTAVEDPSNNPDASEDVTVSETTLTPSEPGAIEIKITETSRGASVYIDGVLMGTVPKRLLDLEAGEHTLRVKRAGYEDYIKQVTIPSGRFADPVYPDLIKIPPGTAYINSDIPEVSVYVDGTYKGKTPLTLESLTPKYYPIKLVKTGYYDATGSLEISSVKPETFEETLIPHPSAPENKAPSSDSFATNEGKAQLSRTFAQVFDPGYWGKYTLEDFKENYDNVYKPDQVSSYYFGDYATLIEGSQYIIQTIKTAKNAQYALFLGNFAAISNTKKQSPIYKDFSDLAALYDNDQSPSTGTLNTMLDTLYLYRQIVYDYDDNTDVENAMYKNIENAITFLHLEGGNQPNTHGDPQIPDNNYPGPEYQGNADSSSSGSVFSSITNAVGDLISGIGNAIASYL